MKLHTVDLAIIVLYIFGITLMGAWIGAKQKDIKGYFVGDRNVHWFLVLISIVATETSAITFLSVPGRSFDLKGGNFTFLQIALGYIIGRLLISWLLLPAYFRGECFTAYEVLKQRFDVRVQRAASALFLMTRTFADGLRLFLTAMLVNAATGGDMVLTIVVLGLVTLLYTYIGGMQAVIWTDLIQFFICLGGAFAAGYYLLAAIPGGWDTFVSQGEAAGKFKMFDFDFTLRKDMTFWSALLGGAFITMASHGADQSMVQRYLCARSLKEARRSLVLSSFVVLFQFTLFLAIGVGLFAAYQTGAFAVVAPGTVDQVFGQFIVEKMPVGLVGIVVAAVLAVAMSSMSSSLNSASNAFVNDFYRPMKPNRSDAHYLKVAKLATLFWGALKIASATLAYALLDDTSIIDVALKVAGLTTGVVLGLFILGQMKKPVASGSALVGMASGFAVVLWAWGMTYFKVFTIPWPLFAPIGALSVVLLAYVADLFFDSPKQLAG